MPSGKKDIYGNKSKALYKAGTVASERAAIANRDPARARRAMEILAREGTTNASGGRPNRPATPKPATKTPIKATRAASPQGSGMGAVSDRDMQLIKGAGARLASKPKPMPEPISKTKPMPKVKPSPAKTPKPQVIRTTTNMKPTPTGKKR